MTWLINGVDPRAAYGLVVSDIQGWADDVQERYPTVAVPGIPGLVRTSPIAEVQPRKLGASGTIIGVGTTAAARVADARTKLDGIRALFAPSGLTIIMADNLTRQLTADCEQIVVLPGAAQMVADRLGVQITLTCSDPYYYDVGPTVVGPTTNPVLPLGNAPVRPVITMTVAANTNNPGWTLKNRVTDATVGSLQLGFAMVPGDTVVIDCAARSITLNGVSRLDLLVSGDFFLLDPIAIASYATAVWPQLIRTSGNMTTTVSYSRAWR